MNKYTESDIPFSEKLKNFWFYNKNKVLIIGFFVVATVYSIVFLLMQPKPDYTILLAARCQQSSDMLADMKSYLANYGRDVNGDGKVTIDIIDCCADGADAKAATQFFSKLEMDDTAIYLLDDEKLDYLRKYFSEDGEDAFLRVFDGTDDLSCKDSKFDERYEQTYGTLHFIIRNPEKSNIGKDAENTIQNAIELVNNTVRDKPTAQ